MIKACFYNLDNGMIEGFKLTGHADYDDIGLDIICSAVTSNAIAVINSLERIVKSEFERVSADEGIIECFVTMDSLRDSQLLFEHLKLALTSIEQEYPDNIKILEVGGDSKC